MHTLTRIVVGLLVTWVPTAVTVAGAADAVGIPCDSSFNPYTVGAATLQRCGIATFPHRPTIVLPGGGKEYDYPTPGGEVVVRVPPSTFNPLRASQAELTFYQLPARPAGATALAQWESMMARSHIVTPPPALVSVPSPGRPLSRATAPGISSLSVSQTTSANWAGYLTNSTNSRNAYSQANAQYTEPDKVSTPCAAYPGLGVWVGLGGYRTGNIAQIGTAMQAPQLQDHEVWWALSGSLQEGKPLSTALGYNIIGHAGYAVTVLAGYSGTPHTVAFYAYDSYSGGMASWSQTDSSYNYDGYTADYIVEKPYNQYASVGLLNFVYINWQWATVQTPTTTYYLNDPSANIPLLNVVMIRPSDGYTMAAATDFTNSYGGFTVNWSNCGY